MWTVTSYSTGGSSGSPSRLRYVKSTWSMSTASRPSGSATGCTASGGPIGTSSTPITRRNPATAVWVWSRTSVNSAIGSRNLYVRNTNPTSAPDVNPEPGPRARPTTTTADTVRTLNTSPDGNRNAPSVP